MIEQLNGVQETVVYQNQFPMRLYRNDEAEQYPPHWHSAVELLMPVTSSYTVRTAGQTITLSPGDVLLIAPGEMHAITSHSQGVRYIFQFEPQLFSRLHGFAHMTTYFSPFALISRSDSEDGVLLQEFADRMYQASVSEDPLRFSVMYLYGLRLLLTACTALQHSSEPKPSPEISSAHGSGKYARKFIEICGYIRDHCTEALTLQETAGICGFSQSHFIRLFKQFSGVTFYHYLNQCRISCAKDLLSTYPNLSVSEVAARSGFHSLATFNRLFRSFSGCTPSEFRKQLRN